MFITTFPEEAETQPEAFVTVNVYVPDISPETVVVMPVPFEVTPSGDLVRVHVPVAGNPFNAALPVADAQVG